MSDAILVAYASNAGSTVEVAQAVGEELARSGAVVDVRPIAGLAAADLAAYRAVVVGAPMILGWHRGAARFVREHRRELANRPLACFATALSLTRMPDPSLDQVSVDVDPRLGKPPRNPRRLSLKERYATVGNYLRPILRATGPVKPVSIGLFGGRLDFGRLKPLQMLFVMLVVGAQPGDYRNWDAIRGWARGLDGRL